MIGRWQRLSTWRKAIAVGAFSAGTFGLGFTLGGLIFGRWRKGACERALRSGPSGRARRRLGGSGVTLDP